jgi:hypothetical protein
MKRSFAPFPTRRGGTQAGHLIGSGGRRREQRHLGVYTPTSAPVSDQEEGLRGLLSRRPRVRVVYS